eukprot:364260-Chlamydomonas_euryale.AAC.4
MLQKPATQLPARSKGSAQTYSSICFSIIKHTVNPHLLLHVYTRPRHAGRRAGERKARDDSRRQHEEKGFQHILKQFGVHMRRAGRRAGNGEARDDRMV